MSVLVGIGLSAACGFRVFVPLLVMSLASLSGHLTLAPGFEWIGTYPALVAFIVATVAEIAGYYIPWVDHLLDVIASPAAVVAGIMAMASTVVGVSPFLRWSLAIIAGGGIAAAFQAVTGLTRVSSTATTAGLANPVVSTIEAASATAFSILALAIPLLCIAVIAVLLMFVWLRGRALLRRLIGLFSSPGQ
jgi:glucan phosphoethanolaminetransferase (alkaline phosphatase superfamily)